MLKLERIQYAALRIALGYRSSTPTNIILGDSRLCMLQHRTKYLCRFIMKNLSNSGSTLYNWVNSLHNSTMWSNLVRKSHNILLSQIHILVHERQLLKTKKATHPFYMNLHFSTISLETEMGYLLKNAADSNSISFFTDDSKDEVSGRVAAACY